MAKIKVVISYRKKNCVFNTVDIMYAHMNKEKAQELFKKLSHELIDADEFEEK